MELLAHQVEIVDAIKNNFITSISVPRQNGKTVAAIEAAFAIGGRVIFVSRGSAGLRNAVDLAASRNPPSKLSRNDRIIHSGGEIRFCAYTKSGSRGVVADALIFDDADTVGADILAEYSASLFAAKNPRIAAFSVAPDVGLAAHLSERADRRLRWCGLDVEAANPALPLLNPRALEDAERLLEPGQYRRQHLGLTEAEWGRLVRREVSRNIAAELNGQVFA